MEEWKEYKISEIIEEIAMGPFGSNIKVDNFIDFGIPVLNGSNLQGFKLNEDSFNYVSEEKADTLGRANAFRGDVVITHRGTLGQIVYIPLDSKYERYIISQSQFRLRLNQNIIRPDFFVYFFHTRIGQHRILMNASQVGVPALARPTSTFKEITIPVPPMEIQNRVMAILLSLNDKIELNRRINENLEQQAQALFKSWFVNFEPFKDGKFVDSELGMIPEGWKVIELQSMVTIKRGGSPRPIQEYLSETGLRWLKISDATCNSSPFILEIKEHIKESGLNKTVLLNKGELVLSNSATPGIPKFLGVDSCIHDGWLYFPVSSLSKEFLYLLFKEKRNELLSQGNGSVFLNLKTEIVKSLKFAICSKNTLDKFDDIIMSIFKKISELSLEIDRLTKLRDTLLPKLMTGEIIVSL